MSTPIFDDEEPARRHPEVRSPGSRKSTPTWVILLIVLGGVPLLICPCLIALLLPAVQQAREAARQTQAKNNLKQIGLAMHNFHDTYSHFPPATIDSDEGQGAVQSWMTDLLPFMDQGGLYEQIDREQLWSSDANKLPFSTVIPIYRDPSDPGEPVNGEGYAIADFAANSRVISDQQRVSLRDITDGSSSTILAGNVSEGHKAWGDPTNSRDPALGLDGGPAAFGSYHPNGVLILMGDGSVRMMSKMTDQDVLRRLADPADGERVDEF